MGNWDCISCVRFLLFWNFMILVIYELFDKILKDIIECLFVLVTLFSRYMLSSVYKRGEKFSVFYIFIYLSFLFFLSLC